MKFSLMRIILLLSSFQSSGSLHCDKKFPGCYCSEYVINCSEVMTELQLDALYIHSANATELALSHQKFTEFDVCTVRNLTKLTKLNLSYGKLKKYPTNITTCGSNIEVLKLSGNRLDSLKSGDFKTFKNIKVLKLDKNNFTLIPKTVFQTLNKLTSLDLSNSNIETIEDMAFTNLSELEIIILSENSISSISDNLFPSHHKLKSIQLERNKITTISDKAFQHLSLVVLKLSDNKIQIIPKTAFKNTYIKTLNLMQNPIHCDCLGLHTLYNATKEGGMLYGTCSSPQKVKDKDLQEVIDYEKQICNKNRLCTGENNNVFINSTVIYEELCVKKETGNKVGDSKYLVIIIVSVSALLIITTLLVLYLCLRLHKLQRSVKLEVMEDISNVNICNGIETQDRDVMRNRAFDTPSENGEVVFVEKNRKKKQEDHTNIQLTKLKTPAIQRMVFNTERRFSCDSEGSLNSLGSHVLKNHMVDINLNTPDQRKKTIGLNPTVIVTEASDQEDN